MYVAGHDKAQEGTKRQERGTSWKTNLNNLNLESSNQSFIPSSFITHRPPW